MVLTIAPYNSESANILNSIYKGVDMQLILVDPAGNDITSTTEKAVIFCRELITDGYNRTSFQFTNEAAFDGVLGKWYLDKTATVTAGAEIIEYAQLVLVRGGSSRPKSVNLVPTANKITATAHGLANGDPICFTANTGATLPSPLTTDTLYFALNVSSDNFEVSANSLSALTLTGGSGSGYLRYAKGLIVAVLSETPTISLMPSNTRDYPVRVYARGLSL